MVASPSRAHPTDKGSDWHYVRRHQFGLREDHPLAGTLSACETPIEMGNSVTGESKLVRCGRYCDTCRSRYRRRVKETARYGLDLSTHPYAYLVTLTAPGAGTDLAAWNPDAAKCWNRLVTALRRFDSSIQFMRNTEVQKRGALHHHVIVLSSLPLTPNRVRKLAVRAGYGWMCDVAPLRGKEDRARTSAYVAKYVTKASDERDGVPWESVNRETGEILTRATYRSWSRSQGYGIPMREVKRRAWVAWQASQDVPAWAFDDYTGPTMWEHTTGEASPP